MQAPQILLFGVPRVLVAGREVRFSRRRSVALLAYLAVAQRRYERETLATLLWPDADRSSGLASLRQSLTDIRRNLGGDVLLESRNWLELRAEVRCDVQEFEHELEAASIASLTKAVERSCSPFMDGFYLSDCEEFESWQEEERSYLSVKRELALERLIGLLTAEGAVAEARHHLAIMTRESPDPDRTEVLARELESLGHTLGVEATERLSSDRAGRVRADRLRDRIILATAATLATILVTVALWGLAGNASVPPPGIARAPASLAVRAAPTLADSQPGHTPAPQPEEHAILTRSLEQEIAVRISASPSLVLSTDAQSSRYVVELSIESTAQGPRCRVSLFHPGAERQLWQRIYPLSDAPLEILGDDPHLARAITIDLARRITTALVQYLSRSGTVPPDPTVNPPI